MIEKVLISSRDTATVYFTNGREPYTVYTDAGNLLDTVRQLLYSIKEVTACTPSKAA